MQVEWLKNNEVLKEENKKLKENLEIQNNESQKEIQILKNQLIQQ